MENKEIKITITLEELDVLVRGLLELQGKIMLPVLQKIDSQAKSQLGVPNEQLM